MKKGEWGASISQWKFVQGNVQFVGERLVAGLIKFFKAKNK